MIFVPFGRPDANIMVACSGQKEALLIGESANKSHVDKSTVMVEVDRFGTKYILGVYLFYTTLTEQTQNQNEATF